MKTFFKRSICLFVCLIMCLTALISCKDKNNGEDTEEITDVQQDGAAFSTVRRENYDGYDFTILYFSSADSHEKDFDAKTLTGEVLNDKVYRKNSVVKETYNINIVFEAKMSDEFITTVRNNAMAGDSQYDVCGVNRNAMSLCTEGYFLDLTTLSDIDTTKEWWDQEWVNTMSIHGSLFSLVGDFSIGALQSLSCLCFNKNLFDERKLEYPYELVESGEWTYGKLLEYITGATVDLNEDGKYTFDNFYGLSGWATEASYSLFYGSGIKFVEKNNQGALEIKYDVERLTRVYEAVYRIWNVENNYRLSGGTAEHSYPWDVFKDDRSLFHDTTLQKIGVFLGDMESDYGIVPIPKYDAEQKNYASYSAYIIPMTCVPINVSDPQRTGNIVEALCTASYDFVTPDIFEIVTKLQNVRDPDSAAMINIIIRTKVFDPSHWYDIPGYGTLSRTLLNSNSTNISSYIKGYAKNAPIKLKEINDLYLEAKNKK